MSNDLLNHLQSTVNLFNSVNIMHHVAPNTILAESVPKPTIEAIVSLVGFLPNEKLEVLYSNNGNFQFDDNVFVGITNARIFKLEKEERYSIFRSEIAAIEHIRNNVFKWDKIECLMKNYTKQTIGIYHKKACEYFLTYLKDSASHPCLNVSVSIITTQEEEQKRAV